MPNHGSLRTVNVLDSFMHYVDAGEGDPIILLHGNPTSSYLWRNVIPHLEPYGRCIAVDLIGMGGSGKPSIDYRLVDHTRYLDAFIEALALSNITFVLHDWGVALGLHYARQHEGNVKRIAFMEGHIQPIDRWDDFDEGGREMFKQLRSEAQGRHMVIEENFFVEVVLQAGTQRTLTDEEMTQYRAPYQEKRSREPLWRWPQEIPIEGQPADGHAIVAANNAFITTSDIPKLLLYGEPGAVIGAETVAWCEANVRNLTAISLGSGLHFLPEDRPHEIGTAIARWLGGPS